MVLGDSMIIITAVINNHPPENNILQGILQRISVIAKGFEVINFHHIKRNLNPLVDINAKEASRQPQGDLNLNNESRLLPIP